MRTQSGTSTPSIAGWGTAARAVSACLVLLAGLGLAAPAAADDTTPPTVVGGTVVRMGDLEATLKLYFSEELDAAFTPLKSDFTPFRASVRVTGHRDPHGASYHRSRSLSRYAFVRVNGNSLELEVGKGGIGANDVFWLQIEDTSRIRDLSGNQAVVPAERVEVDNVYAVRSRYIETPGAPRLPTLATDPIAVDGGTLTVRFDQTLIPFLPITGTGGFSVAGAAQETAVTRVDVTGMTVVLTLDREVDGSETGLELSFETGTTPIRNFHEESTVGFDRLAVVNARTSDTAAPALVAGASTIAGTEVRLRFSEEMNASDPKPAASQFVLSTGAGGTDLGSVSLVDISGSEVRLRTATAALATDAVSLTITDTSNIRDLAGNAMAAVNGFSLTNTTGAAPGEPELAAADAAVLEGNVLTLTFDQALDGTNVPPPAAFTVSGTAPSAIVDAVAIEGGRVLLTLRKAVPGDTRGIEVSYAAGTGPGLRNLWDETVSEITGQAVRVAGADEVAPVFVSAELRGTELKLFFDEPLNAAFASWGPLFGVAVHPWSAHPHFIHGTGTATIQDEVVTVTLREAVREDETDFVVWYSASQAVDNPLQDAAGNKVADVLSSYLTVLDHWGPRLVLGTVSGTSVKLYFHEELDDSVAPAASVFTVTVDDVAVTPGSIAVAGTRVTMELPAAAGSTATVQVAFSGATGIRDRHGNEAELENVTYTLTNLDAPAVIDVAVASDAGDDATYGLGETIRVRLTFSEAVAVSGAPRLKIDMDPEQGGEHWAAYESGGGAGELTFVHEVVEPNRSSRGIAVLAHTLELNGGTIGSVATATAAHLPHAGLGHDPAHRVDWRLTLPLAGAASVTAVAVVSDAGGDTTYALGETIRIRLTFSEAVSVSGAPRLKIDMDPAYWGEKWAVYESGSGTGELTFAHEVVEPNRSSGGIAVLAHTLELNGGTIGSVATATAAHLSHAGLGHNPWHKVDWRVTPPTTPPPAAATVTGVAVSSDAGGDATYTLGETIRIRLTFSEAVSVSGAPRLKIDMDPAYWGEKWAEYESGGGTGELIFAHEVVEPNESTRGIAVLAHTLELNGGTIGSGTPATAAHLSHAGLEHDPAHKVAWRLTPAPAGVATVTGVAVSSDAGGDATYALGETIRIRLTFSEAVSVSGAPRLQIDMDPEQGGEKWAAYESGGGTSELTFAHEVVWPNESTRGIAVPVATLELNGGTIRSVATLTAAHLSHAGLGHDPAHRVDWRLPRPVTVKSARVMSDADSDGVYGAGETVEAAVTFDAPVRVETAEGTPTLALIADGAIRRAAYASGSGTARLMFGYRVSEDDGALSAVGVAAGGLRPDGGAITGADGTVVELGYGEAPGVTAVSVADEADGRWAAGGTVAVTLRFAEPVVVAGEPSVGLVLGGGARRAAYAGGSGSDALEFRYRLAEADVAQVSVQVSGDSLRLDGGSILSAGGGLAAVLAHPGAERTLELAPPAVTGVAVISDAGLDNKPAPEGSLTAAFHGVPVEHDGEGAFSFGLTFSEEVMVRARTLKEQALWVKNARVTRAQRVVKGENRRWTITVKPDSSEDVLVVLLPAANCRAAAAICAAGNKPLSNAARARVLGPALLSAADAEAREGVDPALEFAVRLSRAAFGEVTVDYATADGTATAGEDYTATSGTLTFAAGEREQTVSVPILDDGHDEGRETFTLTLSDATGAHIEDGEATGAILNTDPMPGAWLARFGRTLAEQVLGGVQARLEASRAGGAQARVAGQALGDGYDEEAARLDAEALGLWLAGAEEQPQTVTSQEVLAGSAFALTAAAEEGGGAAALWGRGGWSRFDGRDGALRVDGEVLSAALGADYRSGGWLAGAMLGHARGEGSYAGDGGDGTVTSAVTGVFPYAGVDLSERLTAWAAAGLGLGGLTLTPEAARELETDLALVLAVLGARGRLLEPAGGSGFSLALDTDALWVRTSSEAAPGLAEAQADVTRLRLGLDGGYRFVLDGGGALEPSFAIGVRHDGGDAENGYGMDLGGGLAWTDRALGLAAELSARGLLTYGSEGFRDVGVSGSLAWDPDPSSDRGPSVTVVQTLGSSATGGMDALLGRATLAGLAAPGDGLHSRRLELRAGYGLAAFGDRFTATPELGLALAPEWREYRLGWGLTLAAGGPTAFELALEATRRERHGAAAPPEHSLGASVTGRW